MAARVGLVTASKGPDHKSRPTLNPLISQVPSYKRTPKVAKKVAKKVGPKEEVEVVTADGLSFERRRSSTPGQPGLPWAAQQQQFPPSGVVWRMLGRMIVKVAVLHYR